MSVSVSSSNAPNNDCCPLASNETYKKIVSVTSWTDPIESALIFLTISSFYVLINFCDYGYLYLVSNLLVTLFLFSIGNLFVQKIINVATKKPDANPYEKFQGKELQISADSIKSFAEFLIIVTNYKLNIFFKALFVEDLIFTVKSVSFLCFVGLISDLVSLLTWGYIFVVLAFVIPTVYKLKKAQIDNVLALVSKQYAQHVGRIEQQIRGVLQTVSSKIFKPKTQ
eukprot:CAMPEP_0184336996 /NCGR_PEP_ID=MMETSP1089-20130417/5305_1 /TAXON_ID=38269 ORGANISM="Gloeochaete wittrockiana, Strain SAG46.84" /NCGR_SAMPLE_ID=MMETSP1089 /ASSEMBLY_ACC=CAM_ASM_000445 /LENGTH=225 /DNA_ID=CAMNT_0026662341 /DNA_START=17 /DNA_END=694 /DNA_ORIENTATION=+